MTVSFVPTTYVAGNRWNTATANSLETRIDTAFDQTETDFNTVKAGLDLKLTDYTGIDRLGGSNMAAKINTAAIDANAVAVAGGHKAVNLIIPRGDYRIDAYVEFRDRVRFILDDARIFAGADIAGNGLFRTINPNTAPVAAAAQGTATTTAGDYVLRNVSLPFSWDDSMIVTGTGIPALAHVELVDDYDATIVMDKAATASGTITITRAATWHGQYNNCGLIGGLFDQNQKHVGAGIFAAWTKGFRLAYTEVLHNHPGDGTDANWAFAILQARDAVLLEPKVTGGRAVWEDGVHISGTRISVVAPNVETGDDVIAIGDEDPGSGSVGFPAGCAVLQQGSRWITVTDPICNSLRGFAVKLYSFGNCGPVRDITVTGITGRAGVYRNGGIYFTDNLGSNPGSNRISKVHIEGQLEVGSLAHAGTAGGTLDFNDVPLASPVGPVDAVYADSADDVYIDLALKVQEPIAPTLNAAGRIIWHFTGCNNVTLGPRCAELEVVRGKYTLFSINNCPNFNVLAEKVGNMSRHTYHVEFKDDFVGRSLDTTKWATHLGSNANCAAAVAASVGRGSVTLSTGNDAAGTMATNGAQIDGGLNWHRENGVQAQGLSMEAIAQVSGATFLHCAFIGYTNQNTALQMPFTLVGSTLTTNIADGFGFLVDSSATNPNWYAVAVRAGVATTPVDLGVAVDLVNFTRLSASGQTSGAVTFFVNGVKRAVVSAAAPSVLLCPVAAVFSRGANLRFLNVDMIRCEMRRAN